jgi:NAD(P)-dependent dehydrogenase (short-subunit alcohol dehydrogenase family)
VSVASLIDDVLDRTVAPGYTSVGYRIRSRGWDNGALAGMDGKVVLVTGATSGLGAAAAEAFAKLGARVWLVARDRGRAEAMRDQIVTRSGNDAVEIGVCDLSRLASIREFAHDFRSRSERLDVLVNNAGVLPPERTLTDDGIETTFATNVVGPFLLTELLLPALRASAPARVINVSSGGMYTQKLHADDLNMEHDAFDGSVAYSRTKRAEVILTEELARTLDGSGVVVHSMHPGWVDTPGVRSSLPRFYRLMKPFLRTAEQGADTIVWLGAAEEPASSTGGFWHDRRQRPTHLLPWTHESREEREMLLAECVRLSGLEEA